MIVDKNNENFLAIIELLSRHNPLLHDHVSKVKETQQEGRCLQAHCLSYPSQNEFIQLCAENVKTFIHKEREESK